MVCTPRVHQLIIQNIIIRRQRMHFSNNNQLFNKCRIRCSLRFINVISLIFLLLNAIFNKMIYLLTVIIFPIWFVRNFRFVFPFIYIIIIIIWTWVLILISFLDFLPSPLFLILLDSGLSIYSHSFSFWLSLHLLI